MKYLLTLLLLFTLYAFAPSDDIYDLSFKNLDGKKIQLNTFKGKKMMFVILPASDKDTTIRFKELEKLQKKYDSILVVIGILSEEEGYKKQDDSKFKKMYVSKQPNILITEGMKVKKNAGEGQTALFKWLTNKDKNKHFNQDVRGVGHKFFVDEDGKLYAVMGPEIKLDNPVIHRILSKPLHK